MKYVLRYIRPYLGRMGVGLSIKSIGTLMELFIPYILAFMIDEVVPLRRVDAILFWGGVMLLCSFIAVAGNIIANRMAAKVSRDTTEALRHDLFEKIIHLSCGQIDAFTIPSLESRLTSDTYHVHHMLGMMQRMGVRAPILLVGGIFVTMTMEPVLTLVLLCVLPFISLVMWQVSRRGIALFTQLQQAVDAMVRVVRENMRGVRVIKALSKSEYEKQRFEASNQTVVAREKKANLTMAITNPVMNLLLNGGLTLVVIVGAFRVNAGLSQSGKIIAFLSYFTIILNAMMAVTRMFVMYSKGGASAARISRILDAPQDLKVQPYARQESEYHVQFQNVSFSYLKKQDNIKDISFALKRGETLGIIGPTGCGKSTIMNLLMRLYDADSGKIFIDGQRVESILPETLHTLFGMVFQDDVLFADTILENIRFGRNLSEEQVLAAVEYAQAREFIDALPDGIHHRLTAKGTNLSGGQKQRVLIARALAGDPEILILDDSSSALDYRTDALLRGAVGEHYKNTTTIIIAQRVSSILHADHILVLEDGRALGYGTHEELLDKCKLYRDISRTQMGGERIA